MRHRGAALRWLAAVLAALALGAPAGAAPADAADPVVDARDALRRKDKPRLAAIRAKLVAARHPLAPWVDYWELLNRLNEARAEEVQEFLARNAGTYVEDRLRNDWLLEAGRRRDAAAVAQEFPRFRMNDDREVTCYALWADHLSGRDVREAARIAWWAQREPDDGCALLASTLFEARLLKPEDVWRKARLSLEQSRPQAARVAVALLGGMPAREIGEVLDNPLRFLRRHSSEFSVTHQELFVLALARVAANDPDVAAGQLEDRWQAVLSTERAAWAWAVTGRQAATRLQVEASAYYQRAWSLVRKGQAAPGWSDDTVAWAARAALRVTRARDRWPQLLRAVDAMSPEQLRDPAWNYWRARALQATAPEGERGDAQREDARRQLAALASPLHFYGQHAADDLGLKLTLPEPPEALSPAELAAAAASPGLSRALQLAALGLRDEARREWNYTLRGMGDRELLAAARLACDASDWQLCINTSERTRAQVDVALRYPMPFAAEIQGAASATGLEPALVFGLIRQETRFMPQLKSSAGATGLMQLMPTTARWVARKMGFDLKGEQVNDPPVNLKLGTTYLKLVLDDLGGSQPMAAAAYNAGPGRPRRWREGPVMEPAAWAENIPFNETRDYVKKVMSNAAVYAALLNGQQPVLKPRLGQSIGPRDASAPSPVADLP